MAKNRCGMENRIGRLMMTGTQMCHQNGRRVPIIADAENGNHCADTKCRFSPAYVKPTDEPPVVLGEMYCCEEEG